MNVLYLLILAALSSPAFADAPTLNGVLAAVVFDGLIAAVFAVAVLSIGVVLAKKGSAALLEFISRIAGCEQVLVGKHGYWDKDVYDDAMRDLQRHYRAGGILDREARDELAHWQLDHPEEMGRGYRHKRNR